MASAVFFLLLLFRLLRDRTLTADLFVQLYKSAAQLLILAELGNLALRLALRLRIGEALGHRLTSRLVGEAERGAVARLPRLMTVTAGVPAAPLGGGDRSRPKVTQFGDLMQNRPTFCFQGRKRIWHKVPPYA
jgi:hypothetical protein